MTAPMKEWHGRRIGKTAVRIADEMTWPGIDGLDDLEWTLRYGYPQDVMDIRMVAAEVVSAYQHMILCPGRKRDAVIRCIREAAKSPSD